MKTQKSIQGVVLTEKHFRSNATVIYCDNGSSKSEVGILVKDANYPGAVFVAYVIESNSSSFKTNNYSSPKLTYTSALRWPAPKKEFTLDDLLN